MPRKRNFRLSETQAEIVIVALTYFIMKNESNPEWAAHIKAAEALLRKLENYTWEVTENEELDS